MTCALLSLAPAQVCIVVGSQKPWASLTITMVGTRTLLCTLIRMETLTSMPRMGQLAGSTAKRTLQLVARLQTRQLKHRRIRRTTNQLRQLEMPMIDHQLRHQNEALHLRNHHYQQM